MSIVQAGFTWNAHSGLGVAVPFHPSPGRPWGRGGVVTPFHVEHRLGGAGWVFHVKREGGGVERVSRGTGV